MDTFEELKHLLFIDIETVPQYPSFDDVDPVGQALWEKKAFYINEQFSPQDLYHRAGIYAEFGKIICIGVAYFHVNKEKTLELRVKSIYDNDEKELLSKFKELIRRFDEKRIRLVAHNGKEFDFPYLSRRMIINGISLPVSLDFSGKKPWEIPHLDTLELWKFGDRKNYTSLELLAYCLGISTEKSDMNGSLVYETYYQHQDLSKIADYCANDVILLAQIFLKMNIQPLLEQQQIVRVK